MAARVLSENGVKKEKVIGLVSQLISPDQTVRMEENGYTPSARRVLENSYKEAVRFKARLIGTEHLLISIIRDNDCVASRLLNTIGIRSFISTFWPPWVRMRLPTRRNF